MLGNIASMVRTPSPVTKERILSASIPAGSLVQSQMHLMIDTDICIYIYTEFANHSLGTHLYFLRKHLDM